MALFAINRYLGEDEDNEEDNENDIDHLAKLKSEALKRKAEREEIKKSKKFKRSKKTKKEKTKQESQNDFIPRDESYELTENAEELQLPEPEPEIIDGLLQEPLEDADAKRPSELGGFTVLSATVQKEKESVDRVLPEWLSKPLVISVDLNEDKTLIEKEPSIDNRLKDSLIKQKILHFFPVQRCVVPHILGSLCPGTLFLDPPYLRPNDICVSAPTGSGKTLAYVVPILQALSHRVVIHIRALIVLPVTDLAVQVYKVFLTHAPSVGLKVGLAVSGHQTLQKEQSYLVTNAKLGARSSVDILVATPGRLVDHLRKTPGFSLRKLRFLVIDEADRMMQDVKQDWLEMVEDAALEGRHETLDQALCLGGTNQPDRLVYPLQKLLFSATLSQNPEKLEHLRLFQPKLFTSALKPPDITSEPQPSQPQAGQFLGKFTTPLGLSEYTCLIKNASLKPLVVLFFAIHLKFRRMLVFTNTKENARRLRLLIEGFGSEVIAREFSSKLTPAKRERILTNFAKGKVDIVICTDAMARGMDLEGVKWVVSYDCPKFVKTYIHRVGRTARAGRAGSAITLLEESQRDHFASMMEEASKDVKAMHKIRAGDSELKPFFEQYQTALEHLRTQTEATNDKRRKQKRKNSQTLQGSQVVGIENAKDSC